MPSMGFDPACAMPVQGSSPSRGHTCCAALPSGPVRAPVEWRLCRLPTRRLCRCSLGPSSPSAFGPCAYHPPHQQLHLASTAALLLLNSQPLYDPHIFLTIAVFSVVVTIRRPAQIPTNILSCACQRCKTSPSVLVTPVPLLGKWQQCRHEQTDMLACTRAQMLSQPRRAGCPQSSQAWSGMELRCTTSCPDVHIVRVLIISGLNIRDLDLLLEKLCLRMGAQEGEASLAKLHGGVRSSRGGRSVPLGWPDLQGPGTIPRAALCTHAPFRLLRDLSSL